MFSTNSINHSLAIVGFIFMNTDGRGQHYFINYESKFAAVRNTFGLGAHSYFLVLDTYAQMISPLTISVYFLINRPL